MSTAEILSLISKISFAVAAISFALAIFFWFSFKIPAVIGDLSGRTAKKSIAKMREKNEKAGGQGYGPSVANANRGKLTDAIRDAGEMKENSSKKPAPSKNTAAPKSAETDLLVSGDTAASEVLLTESFDSGEVTGLLNDVKETASLFVVDQKSVRRSSGKKLTMLDDVMLIHTDEVI